MRPPPADPVTDRRVMSRIRRNVDIGSMVHYESRTGNYECPALVTATTDSLYEPNVTAGFIPGLTTDEHVHLTVFTPGRPGARDTAADFKVESEYGRSENVGGLYQEWDIPHSDDLDPGTWHWPGECDD